VEANSSVSPQGLDELIKTSVPISSIHSPCPAVLSSKGIPVANLSLSSLDESEREEAVNFAKKTIDLVSDVDAKVIILHMGEVPIDIGLESRLRHLYNRNCSQTEEYSQTREELIHQRASKVSPYLEAARRSLKELSEYNERRGVVLGLETRFYFHEIPSIDEMDELLKEMEGKQVGYWHDVGHAEVQQRLGFASHQEWLTRFSHRTVGIHLHDVLGISDHRPPGSGDVDWRVVAKYLPSGVVKVCEIAEWNEEKNVQGVVGFLQGKGVL
jgi:sugar phosphate isomerase/epimerase